MLFQIQKFDLPAPVPAVSKPTPVQTAIPPLISSPKPAQAVLNTSTPNQAVVKAATQNQTATPKIVTPVPVVKGKLVTTPQFYSINLKYFQVLQLEYRVQLAAQLSDRQPLNKSAESNF